MEAKLPVAETVRFAGPLVDERGIVHKHRLQVGAAESLGVMEDKIFFTPAVLYLWGSFFDGPLIDCMAELGCDIPLYFHMFDFPVFAGLNTRDGDQDWNYVLWAVDAEFWPHLSDFLVSISLTNTERKFVIGYAQQELTILDPLMLDRKRLIQPEHAVLTVNVFGVNSSAYRVYLQPSPDPLDPPRLTFADGDPAMQAYAKALFEGRNPLNAKENFIRSQAKKEEKNEN